MSDNIFAVGDCAWTKYNEEKNVVAIMTLAPHVINNIKSLSNGEKANSQNPGAEMSTTAFISLGPEYAIMVMNGNVVANKDIGAQKLAIHKSSMLGFKAPPIVEAS